MKILHINLFSFLFLRSPSNTTKSSYIITGSIDDKVKVWEYDKDTLKLAHTLKGHSLGIMSVAVNSKGNGSYISSSF